MAAQYGLDDLHHIKCQIAVTSKRGEISRSMPFWYIGDIRRWEAALPESAKPSQSQQSLN
jgi:hypothetical protein